MRCLICCWLQVYGSDRERSCKGLRKNMGMANHHAGKGLRKKMGIGDHCEWERQSLRFFVGFIFLSASFMTFSFFWFWFYLVCFIYFVLLYIF